jgi:cytoskeletal protein CcmA (bactofilin family)
VAKQRVELLRPSRVTGTIRTPCLVVTEGAVFNGHCEMTGGAPFAPSAETTPSGADPA